MSQLKIIKKEKLQSKIDKAKNYLKAKQIAFLEGTGQPAIEDCFEVLEGIMNGTYQISEEFAGAENLQISNNSLAMWKLISEWDKLGGDQLKICLILAIETGDCRRLIQWILKKGKHFPYEIGKDIDISTT